MSRQKKRYVIAIAAALFAAPHARSDESASTSIPDKMLWRGPLSAPARRATVAGAMDTNAAGTATIPGVSTGKKASTLNQLAVGVLGERYPCAAVALMVFDPRAASQSRWQTTLDGVPTSRTVKLIAADARRTEVYDSLFTLSGLPYDPDGRLFVNVKVTTEDLEPDTAVTTISCEVVDDNEVSIIQLVEPKVRMTWRRTNGDLLGLYEVPKVAASDGREK